LWHQYSSIRNSSSYLNNSANLAENMRFGYPLLGFGTQLMYRGSCARYFKTRLKHHHINNYEDQISRIVVCRNNNVLLLLPS
jgi:hypothetical protein